MEGGGKPYRELALLLYYCSAVLTIKVIGFMRHRMLILEPLKEMLASEQRKKKKAQKTCDILMNQRHPHSLSDSPFW